MGSEHIGGHMVLLLTSYNTKNQWINVTDVNKNSKPESYLSGAHTENFRSAKNERPMLNPFMPKWYLCTSIVFLVLGNN